MEQSHNNIVKNLVGSQVREKDIEMPKNPSTCLIFYVWTMTYQRCWKWYLPALSCGGHKKKWKVGVMPKPKTGAAHTLYSGYLWQRRYNCLVTVLFVRADCNTPAATLTLNTLHMVVRLPTLYPAKFLKLRFTYQKWLFCHLLVPGTFDY